MPVFRGRHLKSGTRNKSDVGKLSQQYTYLAGLFLWLTSPALASAFVSQFSSCYNTREAALPMIHSPFSIRGDYHCTALNAERSGPTYFEWLGRQAELKLRPQPYQGLRLKIERDLAVLLMRSSYEVADELDFVPMNDFQKDFFTFRQAEWEDYVGAFPPLSVRQGELTQPSYFDFISFAQYCTLNEEMRHGKLAFVELVSAEGEKRVVRRSDDPSLPQDNSLLPAEHSRRVGDRILQRLLEAPEVYAPRLSGRGGGGGGDVGVEEVVEDVKRIVDLFTAKQFNQGGEVKTLAEKEGARKGGASWQGMKLKVTSRAPANLWSLQSLMFRNEPLLNDFEGKAVRAYLQGVGKKEGTYAVQVQGNDVVHTFSW